LYALVVVLPRYIAPFVVIFWFTVYDAFSSGRLKSVARGAVGATAISILLFQMLVLVKTTAGTDAHLVVAKELERIGLRPGDEIATVGSGFEAYYAQLSKLRIVATIGYTGGPSNDDNLAALNDTDLNAIEDKLRQLHVKAIVGRQSKVLTAGNSWDCIEATGYCVLLLKK
jgi:phage FluMu protein gp41